MNDDRELAAFERTLASARQQLLDCSETSGYWEGQLSSSALSTATAVCALEAYRAAAKERCAADLQTLTRLVSNGRRWLARNQNADGGWGDTTRSFSNISTTVLGWAAMAGGESGGEDCLEDASRAAREWIERAVGTMDTAALAEAVRRRYGKDRTFSVPILTTLALTGRLGPPQNAWREIPQLPFELAACPHQWFAAIRLPVVSYALPALIAMGLVRHHHRPTRNPLQRMLRQGVTERTLRVLRAIQPTTGGYLEATPLTSFVVLSLVGAGRWNHPVVIDAVRFLLDSVRHDGSWPIDTHLATWVTTLSTSALGSTSALRPIDSDPKLQGLRDWLLSQQHNVEHPYTHAAPGGWSWSPLAGGVPDADDTSGALLALRHLNDDASAAVHGAVVQGIQWLLDLQNRDGGIPTFCRGWGTLPFDRSNPDITAHAIRAWLAWHHDLPESQQLQVRVSVRRAVRYLARKQLPSGAWVPLWFGNQHAPDELNLTYGTSRVLLALVALHHSGLQFNSDAPDSLSAIGWLCGAQNPDGGWGGAWHTPASIEETALAVEALSAVLSRDNPADQWPNASVREMTVQAIRRGVSWLVRHTDEGTSFPATPIGFYFAKLWYFERLYPIAFAVAGLGRAWGIRSQLFTSSLNESGAGR